MKTLTCIICPRGCTLNVDNNLTVTGNACKRGEDYVKNEITNPIRTVTSSVRVNNRQNTMLSVKTQSEISKKDIFELMKVIRNTTVNAPITLGDIILKDVFGTNIIATKSID